MSSLDIAIAHPIAVSIKIVFSQSVMSAKSPETTKLFLREQDLNSKSF